MKLTKTHRAAILLGSAALLALSVPATARPSHHHHARVHVATQAPGVAGDVADRDDRYGANAATADNQSARTSARRHSVTAEQSYAAVPAGEPLSGEATQSQSYRRAQSHTNSAFGGFTSDALVTEARKYIGTNPTGRGSLWCGAFLDMVLKHTGHAGGGNLAWGYSRYGTRVAGPQVGAIAVMHGHVGIVSGLDANGNPIIVSGNHNRTVAESVYPRGRIAAYVVP
jgi:uncharacterized protein (TIGR02594 family)